MSVEHFCAAISDKINTGIVIIDLEYKIVMWNRFLQIHANKKSETVINNSIFSVFPELPKKWLMRKIMSVVQLKSQSFCSWEQRHHLFELPHTRPITTDSQFMAQNCTFLPIELEGEIAHICILIEDVTDVCHFQNKLNKALDDLALANRIDGLTQIFNRNHWEECLANEFARAARYGHDLALLMFDFDHFKSINDNYGHRCGDLVLVEITRIIRSLLRLCDLFGRYGGEEFAIILPETNLQGALDVAERIRIAVENSSLIFQGQLVRISVSIGIAEIDPHDSRYEDLIENADVALYKAKTSGRNKVCLSPKHSKSIAS